MDGECRGKHDGTAFGELLRAADSDAPPGVWEVAVMDTITRERRTFLVENIMHYRSMLRPHEVMVSASIGF